MQANWVNVAGLIYDIAGAILLGRAVVFNTKEKIFQQVSTSWDYNKQKIPVVVEGRIDAVVGLTLLVTGFLLQGASAFWSGWWWVLPIALVLLGAVLMVYRLVLPKLVKRGTESVVAF